MAIELKNSMFIHVPKCGGRTVKQMLKKYVAGAKVIGDDIYESQGLDPWVQWVSIHSGRPLKDLC